MAAPAHPAHTSAAALARAGSCPALAHARRICTSDECPMAQIMESMPFLCEPEPPKAEQTPPTAADAAILSSFEKVKPYSDAVWGPAAWTSLQADILTLPKKIDAHEFCMFKIYLALRARYLPCSSCAIHFERHLKEMPNDATHRTRAGLLRWLTNVHNDVNRRKQRQKISEEEIVAILEGKAAIRGEHEESSSSGESSSGEEGSSGEESDGPGGDDDTSNASFTNRQVRDMEANRPDGNSPPASTPTSLAAKPSQTTVLVVVGVVGALLLLVGLGSATRMLSYSIKRRKTAKRIANK